MVSRSVLQVCVFLLVVVSFARGRPSKALDAVDTCLFTCDYCFKGEALLRCANECLSRGGEMGRAWLETCPVFGKPLYFD